ncbi:unnamed protein product, partial [Rotaria sp. Silwood1]
MKRLLSQQHLEKINTVDTTSIMSTAKLFTNNVSPPAKKRATKRLLNKKKNRPRGSISKLRKRLGVNLSKNYNPPSNTPSTLLEDIEEFL